MSGFTRPAPLCREEVEVSRRMHGSNLLSVKRKKSFFRQFLENLGDPVIRILLGALVINLLFSLTGEGADWFETGGIALAVLLATLISTLSEYGSEAAFSRLSEACGQAFCRVRRRETDRGTATVREVPSSEIVVGDTVLLGAGEVIPADGILLAGRLRADQSAMTGESLEVEKKPLREGERIPEAPTPSDGRVLFRGCTVLSGEGEMLVTQVGDSTFLGRISEEVQADTRESPLKVRLSKLAGQISRFGYVAAALVAVVFLLEVFLLDSGFDTTIILQKLTDWRYVWKQFFHALTLGLTVLVVAVPEGLPMMIAVVLSSNIRKMVKDQVLVRKPVGIEAAGSMNILFTDKTGTLTEGRLSIGRILTGDGRDYTDVEDFRRCAPKLFGYFAEGCAVNTASATGQGEGGQRRALGGNATDRALLEAILPYSQHGGEALFRIPFDSTRKSSCAVARRNGREVLLVKGAPERLMARLVDTYRLDGTRGEVDRTSLNRRIQALTERGGRVILVAESTGRGVIPSRARLEGGDYGALTLVCLLLLSDKIRREAPDSVCKLRRAGIHTVMMTGDNRDTARSIAQACGILGQGVDRVIDSEELSRLSDEHVLELLPRLGVVARALPTDKSRLVRIAQEADLVVGMTGDGINDAPALRRADVGFAMGAGTQVAKDAGDIIILDNNLRSIVRAVLYGRTIFKSIRKFITLQLTMNLCAVGVTMICPFIGIEAPVTVVQMLWINLIMDTLGGLAFAGEAPLPSYMEERPKRRDEPILNRYMVGEIAWLGCFTVALCLLFLKLPAITNRFRPAEDSIYLLTAFFALFIFASVFNCFNARTDRVNIFAGLARNKGFCLIMAAVLFVQILFVYVGGAVLRTAPLTAEELGLTFLLALTVFPAEFVRKIGRRLSGRGEGY